MADITYDIDDIRNVKLAIDDLVEALDKSCSTLNEKLETLRKAWNTKAGTKFFNDHKDSWTKSVKKYSKKLVGLSDMLNAAIVEYEQIDNDVSSLNA